MGLNVDLCQILNAPKKVSCPRCEHKQSSMFDDYDIECGQPNPKPGRWELDCYCAKCGHNWTMKFTVTVQPEKI